jgi:phosphatidate cytidylyltransferase
LILKLTKEGFLLKQRVISAAVLISLVIACMIISPYTRILMFTAAAVLSVRELKNVFRLRDVKYVDWVVYAFIGGEAALTTAGLSAGVSFVYYLAVVFAAMFCVMLAGIVKADVHGPGAVATMSTLLYPMFPYAAITYIGVSRGWESVFILACLSTWICDSAALFGGKAFGKHKVAPYVSPHKTVEGCISGAVSAIPTGIICFYIIKALDTYGVVLVPMWLCIATALVASTFGQVGDLAASLLKRMVGIKDYSNLIPGHGGMMDRSDSLLFSIPVAWFCLYVFNVL